MSIRRRTTTRGDVRYDVRLRDPTGRVYGRTFRTKREAEAFVADEWVDRARATWSDLRAAETPFSAVAGEWLHGGPSKRSGTVATDGSVLDAHLLPAFGPTHIGRISPSPQVTLALYPQITGTGDRNAVRQVGRKLMPSARRWTTRRTI